MSLFDPRDIPKVRSILSFLREDLGDDAFAYYPKDESAYLAWTFPIRNYSVYTSEDFRLTRQAIRQKYPKLKTIFIYHTQDNYKNVTLIR